MDAKREKSMIRSILTAAAIVAAIACGRASVSPQIIEATPAQQVRSVEDGDGVQIHIISNRIAGETDDELLARHVALYQAWQRMENR